jgi:dipeptidase E
MAVEVVLLSSTQVFGAPPLAYARDLLAEHLAGCGTLHFAPFAMADHDAYTARIAGLLAPFGVRTIGLHTIAARPAVEQAEALFVGGGNTFRLLATLQQLDLVEPIRRRVLAGQLRYLGSSAGTNVACPSLRTTNDMPIVMPNSFDALGLVPFQINPHYLDPDPASTHMGDTREQRIEQFLEANDVPVVGLREGAWLRRQDQRLALGGIAGARLFQRNQAPQELDPGADLSWLLQVQPRLDSPA